MNKAVSNYPALQFALFRIVFGTYLLFHFLHLVPTSADIWSETGMLGDASLNLTYGMFPNILNIFHSPLQIQIFTGVMCVLALLLVLGVSRRTVAILLWYGWACLFHRNNLISNPGLPMVGWLLLALALIPLGEGLALRKAKPGESWYMPSLLFYGAWWIVAIAYTISGIDKFLAPSWRDGSALLHLLHNPLARDWFVRDMMLALPVTLIHAQTWIALGLEMIFGVLCIFRKTRPLAWFLIMGMHAGILIVVDFADLTIGVMMIHFFTFDPNWFRPHRKASGGDDKRVVLFDGVCNICNSSVNFLMQVDKAKVLQYSTLQGEFALQVFGRPLEGDPQSIVFYDGGKTYSQSTAVIKIARELGGIFVFISVLILIPAPVRDAIYNFIARNRYRIFGKKETCRIPTPEERARFID